jgi:eukaryotic-like serine/threonine-protein kinase
VPPNCVVPNVVGRSLRIAKVRIVKAHCKVGTITRKTSRLAKKGRVLGEVPRAGRKLKNGAKVNLIVGKGPRR